jgi:hypothetical protein
VRHQENSAILTADESFLGGFTDPNDPSAANAAESGFSPAAPTGVPSANATSRPGYSTQISAGGAFYVGAYVAFDTSTWAFTAGPAAGMGWAVSATEAPAVTDSGNGILGVAAWGPAVGVVSASESDDGSTSVTGKVGGGRGIWGGTLGVTQQTDADGNTSDSLVGTGGVGMGSFAAITHTWTWNDVKSWFGIQPDVPTLSDLDQMAPPGVTVADPDAPGPDVSEFSSDTDTTPATTTDEPDGDTTDTPSDTPASEPNGDEAPSGQDGSSDASDTSSDGDAPSGASSDGDSTAGSGSSSNESTSGGESASGGDSSDGGGSSSDGGGSSSDGGSSSSDGGGSGSDGGSSSSDGGGSSTSSSSSGGDGGGGE